MINILNKKLLLLSLLILFGCSKEDELSEIDESDILGRHYLIMDNPKSYFNYIDNETGETLTLKEGYIEFLNEDTDYCTGGVCDRKGSWDIEFEHEIGYGYNAHFKWRIEGNKIILNDYYKDGTPVILAEITKSNGYYTMKSKVAYQDLIFYFK